MKSAFLVSIWLFLMTFLPAQVYSYTIDDTTNIGVGYSHDTVDTYRGTTDFLGDDFNTAGIDVSFAGSIMTIDLYTKFDGSSTAAPVALSLADLFFSTGSGWNYAIDMNTYSSGQGSLYNVNSWVTSESILQGKTSANWQYGRYYEGDKDSDNIIVDGDGTGLGVATFKSIVNASSGYVYSLSFDTTPLGLIAGQDIGIHWATAYCANDLVIGTVTAPVPEPATMLLFGTGLVGLAGMARRRKNS